MKKMSLLLSTVLLSSSLALSSLPAHANLPAAIDGKELPSLAPMLEGVTPGVVLVSVSGTQEVRQRAADPFSFFFGNPRNRAPSRERPFQGLGSGVIIDAKEGYIVTNNHVVKEADKIRINLKDGRELEATKIGSDEKSDIALLKVDAKDLVEIKFSDSDNLRVGDFAVAIGSPFGLGQTVTSGIVSALGRSGLNAGNYEDFIQTDAAINSGNSGGALVNLRGELIGINTAIIGPNGGNVGIGFAIPANMVQNLVDQIIEFGEVRRGVLGISGRSVTSVIAEEMELETNQGAFIESVSEDSAADEAGIEPGDVIISINGKKIKSFEELRGKIGSIGAGSKVKLGVIKTSGKKKTYTVKLQKADGSSVAPGAIHRMLEGADLENGDNGVLVKGVANNSPAASAGLTEGDVIFGVNKKRVKNLADLRKLLENKNSITWLNVKRGKRSLLMRIN